MSLTSYRAAPPRVMAPICGPGGFCCLWDEGFFGGFAYRLCRPGGDLLSRALRRSTIGPGGLNDRVRNGIGWGPSGKATRSTKRMRRRHQTSEHCKARMSFNENDQADRAISTSKLHASRRFHTWPIDVVVYHGSRRILVLRWVSRLDAFSGYPVRT